jgi:Alpha-L-fucosidase
MSSRSIWSRRSLFGQPLAVALLFFLSILNPTVIHAKETPRQQLANAKLGLFVHYVFGMTQAAPGRPPMRNVVAFANALDVIGIARMAKTMGAQYVVFTSMHWRMTVLFPSHVWGSLFPDHVTERDVIGDLAQALNREHIRLVLYVHPDDRHDFTKPMIEKLIHAGYCSPGFHGGEPRDPKWNRLYYHLLNEIGQRYGNKIAGYWEDDGGAGSNGLKVQSIMEHYTPDTPGAAIWVNGNVSHPPATLVGGENWKLFDHNPAPHLYNTSTHQVAIVIAKNWWATKGKLEYTPASMYRFLICSIGTEGQHNGGVVYATSPFSDNQWEAGVPAGLAALGKMIKANAEAIYNTVPSHAYVSGEAASQKPSWGVAVDSRNGRTVFLHVLMPPSVRTFQIGKPANGVAFSRAALLNGSVVTLQSDPSGYRLTLPQVAMWDQVDTVIALNVK